MEGPAMCANIWKENTGFVDVCVQKLLGGVVGGSYKELLQGKGKHRKTQKLMPWIRCPWSAVSLLDLTPWSTPQMSPCHCMCWCKLPPSTACWPGQWERLADRTVGVMVDSIEMPFNTFWCPVGILCLASALFWFLNGFLIQKSWKEAVVQLF